MNFQKSLVKPKMEWFDTELTKIQAEYTLLSHRIYNKLIKSKKGYVQKT